MRIRRGSSGEDDDPSWLIREGEGSPDEEEAADPPWLVREGVREVGQGVFGGGEGQCWTWRWADGGCGGGTVQAPELRKSACGVETCQLLYGGQGRHPQERGPWR